jgi:uncharacterized protein (TIGR02996 family)
MNLPDTKEVAALLDAIKNDPFDDTARLVLADLIQEHVPNSENLQAAYRGGAKKHIEDFCARAVAYYDASDWYKPPLTPEQQAEVDDYAADHQFFNYEYVVHMVLEMIRTGDHAFRVGSIQEAERMLEDRDEKRAFWDALEVITGYHFDKKFRREMYTTCSC